MDQPVQRLISRLKEHLSDQRLADLICNEGSSVERLIARLHLAVCARCKLSQEEFEELRSIRVMQRDRELFDEPIPEAPLEQFLQKLKMELEQSEPLPKPSGLRIPKISFLEHFSMNPALVTCMVFAFGTILSFCFWWQQRAPRIGENALLVRAEKWDRPATQGVVYQAVRITMTKQTQKQTISHSIYRDVEGKRKPKAVKLDTTVEHVKNTLIEAGLNWDEPLSASGYQSWHDGQHIREDHIARAGAHLLKLTTTVPDGLVSEQSITVRDTDFHPVQRTVALRDSGTVEIAEVDFKVLPWAAVSSDVFEPMADVSSSLAATRAPVLEFPRLPQIVTEQQLDEAELNARLMLNQLHADNGEQIAIHRQRQEIVVEGVVETEERKRELQAQLRVVPHLTVAIQSEGEFKDAPLSSNPTEFRWVRCRMPFRHLHNCWRNVDAASAR